MQSLVPPQSTRSACHRLVAQRLWGSLPKTHPNLAYRKQLGRRMYAIQSCNSQHQLYNVFHNGRNPAWVVGLHLNCSRTQYRFMTAVSAIDSRIFKDLFGTEDIRQVFDDSAYINRCIEVEIALAQAQSNMGVIPKGVAVEITSKAPSMAIDFGRLGKETEIVGYPILPLVRQLSAACGADGAGRYVHWGATTQDIMDTASSLQLKAGLSILEHKLGKVVVALEDLARRYKSTPMAGRTHLQHALPVTFGYKCAVYLSSFYRHQQRLKELRPRALLVQYGGAAGTLASLGSTNAGIKIRRELARILGLVDPPISWHVARDGIAETINFLALVGGSIGKIAYDFILMSSNEIGEISEPFVPQRGASSTMPQKRNPISCEIILAASKTLRSHASLVLDGMVSDFERASGPWHLEWNAIPEAFVTCVGALHQLDFVLSGLVVDEARMLENLYSTKGLIVAEAVMMRLAQEPSVGRQKAHDIVYEGCKEAIEQKQTLFEVLSRKNGVMDVIGKQQLQALCDPIQYLGAAELMVEDVLASNMK